ncbi:hypothetical protein B7494_g8475, partial [Chlorociboria aeruginascens]
MALIKNWLPPTRENWELIVYYFQFFPILTSMQWVISWYGAGKTSTKDRFNIPGKVGWMSMEIFGPATLIYSMYSVPSTIGLAFLPWENRVMGALYVIHYIHRAILGPLLAPSMSPIHPLIWFSAICFQTLNGLSLGGYFGGFGPKPGEAPGSWIGLTIFLLGMIGNIYHDDLLREIRRVALRAQKKQAVEKSFNPNQKNGVDKIYLIPENGLFRWIFYPHYLCEWIEWAGFWLMAGRGCVPARTFVINEIATMLPRALQGRQWYLEKFGEEKVAGKRAVIPGI